MSQYRQDQFINFDGIQKIQQELGKLFEGDWVKPSSRYANDGDWIPATDTLETDTQWHFLLDLPGVDLKDVDVSVHRGEIRIKGEKRSAHAGTVVNSERRSGVFERVLALPDDADESTLNASMQNGVLSLSVDRNGASAARTIPISATRIQIENTIESSLQRCL